MTRIKQLRKFLHYTQAQLADLLNVSRSTVAMWETSSQKPDYDTLNKLSMIFNVPEDFIMNSGIFKNWDNIKKYYNDVVFALQKLIPADLEMPTFSDDFYLIAWLDKRLYFEPDELQLVRWFSFAVKEILITPDGETPNGEPCAEVKITLTQEFQAIIDAHLFHTQKRPDFDEWPISDVMYDVKQELTSPVNELKGIGKRIRELRHRQNMSARQLGSIIGVTENAISQYETGERQLNTETLLQLSDFFGVTVDYLLGREQDAKSAPANYGKGALGDAALYAAYKSAPKETQEAIRLLLKLK